MLIIDTIVVRLPDTFLINLRHASALGTAGVHALLSGYATAVDCGTRYRVLHAHGTVRATLQATGTLDLLTDSDDLGALLVAVLILPGSATQT
nr:hypothetical protein [Kibdelosporangium sp. MJ126-NF4]CTQ91221.1 hypothetical protein [Kibdelosporangium sp. MJ126-NF4]